MTKSGRRKRSTCNVQFRSWGWALSILLDLVPNRIQLGKTDIAEFFVSSVKLVLQALESLDKFVGRCLEH